MTIHSALNSAEAVAPGAVADPRLLSRYGRDRALCDGLLPVRKSGAVTVVATSNPNLGPRVIGQLEQAFGPVALTPCDPSWIATQVAALDAQAMVAHAETSVPTMESCRDMGGAAAKRLWAGIAVMLLAAIALAPEATLQAALLVSIFCLIATSALRAGALWHFLVSRKQAPAQPASHSVLPRISLLVPLFREAEIASRLVARLGRLDYPEHLLEVCLIVEADDTQTQRTLARTDLPPHMQVVAVPKGRIRTKPRALNYALPFTSGDIVGIYDAEDAPAPDQLRQVAAAFAANGPDVACVQGVLSFYNARTSWITRCFAIDYATWFRLMLPGLLRMGLVLPLGGTTLFFRRIAIDALDGWDAHNVTEDADLGLRLARRGYRTVLIDSETAEEATARPVPWIRQRSRWLKGYAMTWMVHMRRPLALYGELGGRRFWGVQILFLGTLMQYALWPLLWVFWAFAFYGGSTLPTPVAGWPLGLLTGVFITAELLVMVAGLAAVQTPDRRWLSPWVVTMILYFPLGVLAVYKALFETIFNPFYWDKTQHGQNGG
ncbi:MAG: glycosyltransferase [Rhodobacteraceae bacterium]|nr:glycosyltransferase [Paracoccaceae bacterium]